MIGAVAVYTPLPLRDADRLTRAHGLGQARAVEGVLAGSVNSNFFVEAERRVFARIYEEQERDGVAYEWALLSHLEAAGVPVPRRVRGPSDPAPGELRVAGKPTALFEVLGGEEVCQRMVTEARAEAVGRLLARCHAAARDFPERREGRFTLGDVRRRLEAEIAPLERPELREAVTLLRATLDEVDAAWDPGLPGGVIHGDLFRDNLRWEGDAVVGVLDWESASDGLWVYDLAVTQLAWCYGDALSEPLLRAMERGYASVRPLEPAERRFLRIARLAAAARFTVTRITDYHLREGSEQVKKDWRRFRDRLVASAALHAD
ncbi:MAG TPA: homoserine kinase [Myxococcales bacterium]|nr:homoserine kinase [Myxococcales bacterium]